MGYSVGLDLGIASVGWSVLDIDTQTIDDLGVRTFSSRNSDNNAERRGFRGSRRLKTRRKTRLGDAKKLLANANFEYSESVKHANPYELRVKGLNEKLSRPEIFKAVTHIVKKRGISYLEDEIIGEDGGSESYTDQVIKNAKLLEEKTPGEIQLERLRENGRVRTGINAKGEYQLNVFTTSAYARELERILRNQAKHYPEITEEFILSFISSENGDKAGLVYRKRPYYHGPGNEANNSPYGRWADYKETGKPAANIFDQLIGIDILGELRASTASVSAQTYNLLNDLNNLTLPRENPKLTKEEKEKILNHLKEDLPKSFTPKALSKFLNHKIEDIKGWRLNNKGNPEIHNMVTYRKWARIFEEYSLDMNNIEIEKIDRLAKVITLNSELDGFIDTLEIEMPELNQSEKDIIIEAFPELKAATPSNQWHSFSLKALNMLLPELLNTSDEQNTILERLDLKVDFREKYADLKRLPAKEILEEVYNPTVSKSVNQAINIFNSIIDRYGKENISHITIEMPRDKNEADQKKTIREINKANADRKEKSNEYFKSKVNWSDEQFEANLRKPGFASKLQYYYEQGGKCAYSGKVILPEDLLTNATEIDHIIPLSISLDDSIHNKVLVMASANQEKGQRTPIQAFRDGAQLGQTEAIYSAWVKSQKFGRKKKNNLLNEENIFDPDVQRGFVNRNLNDTRYTSRIILNAIQSFFSKTDTKVRVVTGSFTHTLRKKWGDALEKDRETRHHHAVDATLCAITPFVKVTPYEYLPDKKTMLDTTTGEMIPYGEYKKMTIYDKKSYVPEWGDEFIGELLPTKLYPKIKFSHQVDRKPNRKVSDATIYSTRKVEKVSKKGKVTNEEYYLGKIKDIYTDDGWKQFEKRKDDLLMKVHDPKTYEMLLEIAEKYPSQVDREQADGKVKSVGVSPFKLYCEENGIPAIRKYSKKGNGPIIRSVKYYDKRLGNHINITKDDYGNNVGESKTGKKVVLLSLNPWRTDVYYDEKTDSYNLLGIKYNHLKFKDGEYGIPNDVYKKLKEEERIPEEAVFKFSLYSGDRIRITDDNESIEGLYHSRTTNNKNYFEMKPIDKDKWEKNEYLKIFGKVSNTQFIKSIKPGMKLEKLNTDYLGKVYEIKQEDLKNII